MNILLLSTDSYGGHGGIALFNRDLAAALTTFAGVGEVVVLPRVIPMPGEHAIPEKVRFVADAAGSDVHYTRALWRTLRRHRFDLVICAHVNLLPVARAASRNPLLVTYGIDAWKRLRNPLSNRLLHQCRGVISISEITHDRFLEWSHYAGKTYLLPNAVRLDRYGIRPKNRELVARYALEGKRVLLTVGRVIAAERYKGFEEVLEILPQLPRDVVYVIAGGGNDAPRLQQKATALGVGDRVVFTGLFAEDKKPDLYGLADVYVMPSRGEGFGFVLLEAMASGVPVIASKHDGGREAVRGGELGLLVDPANPSEITAAIRELLARGGRRIPDGLDYFSFANFERRVHAIIADVQTQPSTPRP